MGQCLGACFKEVPKEEYDQQIAKIKSFLRGNVAKVKKSLQAKMQQASEAMEFERAAEIRDQIHYIEVTVEKQRIISNDRTPGTCSTFIWIRDGYPFRFSSSVNPVDEARETVVSNCFGCG